MISFKQYLTESVSKGVSFEWAIVYEALKGSGKYTDEELLKRNALLIPYDRKLMSDAKKAISHVPKHLWEYAKHSDETEIIGQPVVGIPEPKTDILFGKNNEYRVSVKMSGMIQLASGEGISSGKMLTKVMNEFLEKARGNPIHDNDMMKIIQRISSMPTKMISPQNIERVKKENPKLFKTFLNDDGSINQDFNWKEWEKNNKNEIKDYLKEYIVNNPLFGEILIGEALTGKRTFGENNLATANYIITPGKFVEIDQNYINYVAKNTKIDLRAKSRKGITSAALRFDYKTEEYQINENFIGTIWNKLKSSINKIKLSVSKYFNLLFSSPNDLKGTLKL